MLFVTSFLDRIGEMFQIDFLTLNHILNVLYQFGILENKYK